MFMRFLKPIVIDGVFYHDGDVVPAVVVPKGSHRALLRGNQAEYLDPNAPLPEPVEQPPAVLETPAEDAHVSKSDPKPIAKKSFK